MLFVAAELTQPLGSTVDAYNFDLPEFKNPLVCGFSTRLRTYLGGGAVAASLEDIAQWVRQGYKLDSNRSVDLKNGGKIALVSPKDLSEKERTLWKRCNNRNNTVHFDSSDSIASRKAGLHRKGKPQISAVKRPESVKAHYRKVTRKV